MNFNHIAINCFHNFVTDQNVLEQNRRLLEENRRAERRFFETHNKRVLGNAATLSAGVLTTDL